MLHTVARHGTAGTHAESGSVHPTWYLNSTSCFAIILVVRGKIYTIQTAAVCGCQYTN